MTFANTKKSRTCHNEEPGRRARPREAKLIREDKGIGEFTSLTSNEAALQGIPAPELLIALDEDSDVTAMQPDICISRDGERGKLSNQNSVYDKCIFNKTKIKVEFSNLSKPFHYLFICLFIDRLGSSAFAGKKMFELTITNLICDGR